MEAGKGWMFQETAVVEIDRGECIYLLRRFSSGGIYYFPGLVMPIIILFDFILLFYYFISLLLILGHFPPGRTSQYPEYRGVAAQFTRR